MQWNQFLFPAPTSSYTSRRFLGDIIYIPKYKNKQATDLKDMFTVEDTEVSFDERVLQIAMQAIQLRKQASPCISEENGSSESSHFINPKEGPTEEQLKL